MSNHPVEDLAAFLLGAWRIDRAILDADRCPVGSFTGRAEFVEVPAQRGVLRYEERGTLCLAGHEGPAFRRLDYHVDGTRARVTFTDGRFFHDLDLGRGCDTAEHPCGDDHYRGTFEVVDTGTWVHEWVVEGPRKRHVLRTTFTR